MSCLLALILLAAPPVLQPEVVGPAPTLGTPLTVVYRIPAPQDDVVLAPGKDGKGYRLLDLERTPEPSDPASTVIRMVVQPLALGDVEIAAPIAQVRDASGKAHNVRLAGLTVEIADPLGAVAEPELEPARPVRTVPFRWWPYALAVLVGIVAALLWNALRKKKPEPVQPSAPRPRLSPWARALAKLEDLRPPGREDPEAARARVDAISEVLRVYIEERFGVMAPERTTEEFLTEAYTVHELTEHRAMLKRFLGLCDRVKFAGETPTMDGIGRVLSDARAFVENTVPRIERAA